MSSLQGLLAWVSCLLAWVSCLACGDAWVVSPPGPAEPVLRSLLVLLPQHVLEPLSSTITASQQQTHLASPDTVLGAAALSAAHPAANATAIVLSAALV